MHIAMAGKSHSWLDGMAVGASAACLVHCLALPVLIAALPTLAQSLDIGEGFHTAILLFALPASAFALIGGYRLHGAIIPIAVGGLGLSLLSVAVLLGIRPPFETLLTVAGSLFLAAAHIGNWRMRRRRAQDFRV